MQTNCKLGNLHLRQDLLVTGKYDMPVISPYTGQLPIRLIPFNKARQSKDYDCCVHFFLYDSLFDCVWNSPERYVNLLRKFKAVAGPDFSVWADMPIAQQIFNVYRSRLLMAYWQKQGVNVIPLLTWSDDFSFDFCFDGVRGGTVIISTVGVMNSEKKQHLWKRGATEMLSRVEPKTILIYGNKIDFDFGNVDVIYYEHQVYRGGKGYGR